MQPVATEEVQLTLEHANAILASYVKRRVHVRATGAYGSLDVTDRLKFYSIDDDEDGVFFALPFEDVDLRFFDGPRSLAVFLDGATLHFSMGPGNVYLSLAQDDEDDAS